MAHGNNNKNGNPSSSSSLASPSSCYPLQAAAPSSPISSSTNPNQNSIATSTSFVPSDHNGVINPSRSMQHQEQQSEKDSHAPAGTGNNNAPVSTSISSCLGTPESYCDSANLLQRSHHFQHQGNDNLVQPYNPAVVPSAVHPNFSTSLGTNGSAFNSVIHDYIHSSSSYLHHNSHLSPSAEWIAAENGDTSSILAAAVAKAELDPITAYHHAYQTGSLVEAQYRGLAGIGPGSHMGSGMDSLAPWVSSDMSIGGSGDHPSGDEMSQGHYMVDAMEHSSESPTSAAAATTPSASSLKSLQQQPTSSSTNGTYIKNLVKL